MHVFVACQIDALNKKLVSEFSWNDLLSKTSRCIFTEKHFCGHLGAEEKYFLDVEVVYNR